LSGKDAAPVTAEPLGAAGATAGPQVKVTPVDNLSSAEESKTNSPVRVSVIMV